MRCYIASKATRLHASRYRKAACLSALPAAAHVCASHERRPPEQHLNLTKHIKKQVRQARAAAQRNTILFNYERLLSHSLCAHLPHFMPLCVFSVSVCPCDCLDCVGQIQKRGHPNKKKLPSHIEQAICKIQDDHN